MKNKVKLAIGGTVAIFGAGVGLAVAAFAQPPSQIVRTGPNVADWCASYVSNKVVYDWNQAECPSGTYPVSIVSMPQSFTLVINGVTEDCVLSATVSAGTETDSITCTGGALSPTPTASATGSATPTATPTVTVTATPTATPTASPTASSVAENAVVTASVSHDQMALAVPVPVGYKLSSIDSVSDVTGGFSAVFSSVITDPFNSVGDVGDATLTFTGTIPLSGDSLSIDYTVVQS
jgi:hypothetical protein